MSWKNTIIKGFVSLLKPFSRPSTHSETPRRFLVVSTTGLGDSLWGSPAIHALRNAHPDAYISLLTSPIGREIFCENPHIDEIFVVGTPALPSLVRLYARLKRRYIDCAIIFHTSQRPVLPLCVLIGATRIIGTEGLNKGLDSLLTDRLEKRPVHEIERRIELVCAAGASPVSTSLQLYTSVKDKSRAQDFLNEHGIPSYLPIVGLHPGAKDRFKQWDKDSFIQLGNHLRDHLGCQIIVTGNKTESKLVHSIAKNIPGAIGIAGDLPIRSLASLISKMQLFISNDTGPMHVALAMKTATVALFSPTDPSLCGPYHTHKSLIISKPRTCTPCLKKRCHDPFCMLQISPKEVYSAALKLFYSS